MKKFVFLITIILLILSLSACDLNPMVNKINGNEASAKEKQEEEYTVLDDGTFLYKQSKVSAANKIQFKDEIGNVLLDSTDILFISAKRSDYNGYYIELEFTEDGTIAFANATRNNKGKTISIVLNGEVLLSPTVYDEITDGKVIIANHNSYEELISFFNKFAD